jgi:hypothetical protein
MEGRLKNDNQQKMVNQEDAAGDGWAVIVLRGVRKDGK